MSLFYCHCGEHYADSNEQDHAIYTKDYNACDSCVDETVEITIKSLPRSENWFSKYQKSWRDYR